MFLSSTLAVFSMYGGAFAATPAYIADLFGRKDFSGINGRILTAWSTAGIAGPMIITKLREKSSNDAMVDLASKIDPEVFVNRFGVDASTGLTSLVESKTVSIAKLLELCPPGTIDPSPSLYNSTMYLMAGGLGVAFVNNALMKPVDRKYVRSE